MKPLVITIDGPAGSGKTTISKRLATHLGFRYVDTGALYRGVAFEARALGISAEDDSGLEKLCGVLDIKLILNEKGLRLISKGVDISDYIRTPEISMLASAVSARPIVRKYLLGLQREIGSSGNVVFEGRDMGTVVFPQADIKFFLDASPEIRARRRYLEINSKTTQTLEEVRADMMRRDKNDSQRAIAPLKPAEDAIRIDTSPLTIDEVLEHMLSAINSRFGTQIH